MNAQSIPFTIDADVRLDEATASWQRQGGADVLIRRGPVPESLPGAASKGRFWSAVPGRFLVVSPHGFRFLVEGGERIRYETPGRAAAEVRPFLLSGAWAALAYQRGLLCLHASAVVCADGAHAYTGASEAGKSTLAAALSMRGWPFFSDDVLTLVPRLAHEGARCHVHQDMKVHPDAAALTGVRIQGPVRAKADDDRVYARPGRRWPHVSANLKTLYLLSRGQGPCTVDPLSEVEALKVLYLAVFRPRFAVAILGRSRLFQHLTALQTRISVLRFRRPVAREWFDRGTDCIAEALPPPPPPPALPLSSPPVAGFA